MKKLQFFFEFASFTNRALVENYRLLRREGRKTVDLTNFIRKYFREMTLFYVQLQLLEYLVRSSLITNYNRAVLIFMPCKIM